MDSRGVYARTQKRRFVGFCPLVEAVVDISMQQKWCRIVGYVDGSGTGPIFRSIGPSVAEIWALASVERDFYLAAIRWSWRRKTTVAVEGERRRWCK